MKTSEKTNHLSFIHGFEAALDEVERLLTKKIKSAKSWPNQTASVQNYIKGMQTALQTIIEVKGEK